MLADTSVVAWIALGVSVLSLVVSILAHSLNVRRHREERPQLMLEVFAAGARSLKMPTRLNITLTNVGGSDVMVRAVIYSVKGQSVTWTTPESRDDPTGKTLKARSYLTWTATTSSYCTVEGTIAEATVLISPSVGGIIMAHAEFHPPYSPDPGFQHEMKNPDAPPVPRPRDR